MRIDRAQQPSDTVQGLPERQPARPGLRTWGTLLLVTVFLGVFSTGCAQSPVPGIPEPQANGRENRPVIGLSIASYQEERWQVDRDIFTARCTELGADVVVQNASGDAKLQVEQCRKLLQQGVDVLVVVAQDSTGASVIAQDAAKGRIPIVAYDRLIRNAPVDAYVTYDNERIGVLQAEAVTARIGKGRVLLLEGAPTDDCAVQVHKGHMAVLEPLVKSGDIILLDTLWTPDWNPLEARRLTEDAIAKAGGKVDGVISSNDGTAGGVIAALTTYRLAGKVAVSGQDADLAGCQRIVEGTQTMTVYVPIRAEAEAAAQAAMELARGGKPQTTCTTDNGSMQVPTLLLTPVGVDAANMLDTVIQDGYQKLEDVYQHVPRDKWPE